MGRVNRLMERRALRRAADQALLTSLGSSALSQPGGPPDQDFRYFEFAREQGRPAGNVLPIHDHDPVTAPIPIVDVPTELPRSVPPCEDLAAPDSIDLYDDVLEQAAEPESIHASDSLPPVSAPFDFRPADGGDDFVTPQAAEPVRPVRARGVGESTYVRPQLDFAAGNYRELRWYRTKPAAAVLAVALIAAVICAGWFVMRSPSTAAERSSTVATSAPPAPTKAMPTAAGSPTPEPEPAPPPPAPPPPPPPRPAEPTYSAPQPQYQPRYSEPAPATKPRVDVTRAPMSVAPVPKPVPGSDSNTPGDAPGEKPRRRGCFGFC